MASNYDTANAYDSVNLYDTGGAIVVTVGYQGWLAVLNQLAGTKNLGENEAANFYAYGRDKGQGLLKALNDKAGTVDLDINLVCNKIAGTSQLEALDALNVKAGNAAP